MTKISQRAIFATFILLLGACASSPDSPLDTGELITQRGDKISGYGSAWSEGQQRVANGEDLVKKSAKRLENAEQRLADAQAALAEAEADNAKGRMLIAQGNREMNQAEENYAAAKEDPVFDGSAIPN